MNAGTDSLASRQNVGGFDSSVDYNVNRWLAAEGNLAAYYKTINIIGVGTYGFNDYLVAGGPRLTVRKVFIHALVGMDHQAKTYTLRARGLLLATPSWRQSSAAGCSGR